MPRLIIKERGALEKVFILDKDIATIGKDDPIKGIRNDITLEDKTVSRNHAKICKEGEDYFIEDLGSTNHTFVNGKEIKRVKLVQGDVIAIGLNTLLFEIEENRWNNLSIPLDKIQEFPTNKTINLQDSSFYQKERVKKEAMVRVDLERSFSPHVVDKVTNDGMEISLRVKKVLATILFSDIKGFTPLSERLNPGELAELLSEYFSRTTEIIFKYDGTLDKYMGDAVIAIFGAPIPYSNHAKNAVLAAMEMQEEQTKFKKKLGPRKGFDIKIGIHTGEVIAGYIGSPKRTEYMVLGESVMMAGYLRSLAEPGSILISGQTYELTKANYTMQFIRKVKIPKGEKEIEVYKVLDKP